MRKHLQGTLVAILAVLIASVWAVAPAAAQDEERPGAIENRREKTESGRGRQWNVASAATRGEREADRGERGPARGERDREQGARGERRPQQRVPNFSRGRGPDRDDSAWRELESRFGPRDQARRPGEREVGPRGPGRGPGTFGPPSRTRNAGFERDVRGPGPREGQDVARQLNELNRNLERLIQQLERIADRR